MFGRLLRRLGPDLAVLAASASVAASARGQGHPRPLPPTVDGVIRGVVASRAGLPADSLVLDVATASAQTPDRITDPIVRGPVDGLWTVEAAGPTGERWTARLRVGLTRQVAVAARRLARGATLRENDIALIPAIVWDLPTAGDHLPDRPQPGWVTRRVIAEREVLRLPAVAPAPAVAAGQPVLLVYNGGRNGLRLSVHGIARSAAALGQPVDVRLGPKRFVAGRVAGPGLVTADTLRLP
jgi:flagella basal body P-ring formation protein FlgA